MIRLGLNYYTHRIVRQRNRVRFKTRHQCKYANISKRVKLGTDMRCATTILRARPSDVDPKKLNLINFEVMPLVLVCIIVRHRIGSINTWVQIRLRRELLRYTRCCWFKLRPRVKWTIITSRNKITFSIIILQSDNRTEPMAWWKADLLSCAW